MLITTAAFSPKPHGYLGATAARVLHGAAFNDFMAVVFVLAAVVLAVTVATARRRRRDYDRG